MYAAGSNAHNGTQEGAEVPQQPFNLINMQRRQMVMVVPLAATLAAAGQADAADAPIDTANKCRECSGMGITPCKTCMAWLRRTLTCTTSSIIGTILSHAS